MFGILLGYVAVFVLGGAILVALGLLLVRWITASRFVFAGGFLLATLIMAVAVLSFLDGNADSATIIAVATAILLLAGIGQFIAAFRSCAWRYVAALTCALTSVAFGAFSTLIGGDAFLPGGGKMVIAVSALLALASMVIAVLPRFGVPQEMSDDAMR